MAGTSLNGRVAVVTGSGQSIGRAVAVLLAEQGATVVVNSRRPVNDDGTPTAVDTAAEITTAGGTAHAVFADVGTMDGAAAIVDAAVMQFGRIDILVNNAGFGATVPVEQMQEALWDSVIDANLKGTYATAHFAVPRMREQGGGRIVNVISRVGLAGSATMTAYAAAKAGVVGFTLALSKELIDDGITVNCLAPTANTVRAQRTAAERHAMIRRVIPESSKRTPEHVAPVVAYLVSDAAAGITGQIFYAAAGEITHYSQPAPQRTIFKDGKWTLAELRSVFPSAFGSTLRAADSPLPPT